MICLTIIRKQKYLKTIIHFFIIVYLSYRDGSIIVEFTMYYIAKVTVQPDEVKAEIIINLKTNLTKTFSSKFSITVDVNSLTVSLLQTGETDYQSATSDSRFQTSLLSSTTEGTISTLLPTISSNTDNPTTTGKCPLLICNAKRN